MIDIIIILSFLASSFIGFIIIYKQVSLVKKGDFNIQNILNCVIYGIIFGLSVMVVVSMAIISGIAMDPKTGYTISPLALLIPLVFCLIFVSFYPLIDFLYIALSKETDEGLTPFQKLIGSKIINRFPNRFISVIIAISFYLFIFILPPILLGFAGVPALMIWITFQIIYPLLILTFYGAKGYIAGISNCYFHIPQIKRIGFIGFEDTKRSLKLFKSDPGSYILLGLMLFVFVWAWISMIQTIIFFFTGKMGFSTMSSVFVFITLGMGLIGYFTRYWNRQIKFHAIQIYFAAWLMSAIAVNVFLNFLLVNSTNLAPSLNSFILTKQVVPTYTTYAWAAAAEEFILIVFTSYFFIKKSAKFNVNVQYSKITECGQIFDPLPLFNLIKSRNKTLREHAENTIILMYERIPFKTEVNLNQDKFKDYLFDGICDFNKNSSRICNKILIQLERDVPDIVLPWVIEALESPNYDKSIPVAKSLLNADIKLLEKIPMSVITNLINDLEWRLKQIGLKLLSKMLHNNLAMSYLIYHYKYGKSQSDFIKNIKIEKLVDDPDDKIQVETLNIIAEASVSLPFDVIFDKMRHSNKEIRAAAIKNLKNIRVENINSQFISNITPLLKDPTSSVRAAIFEVFANIGNFKEFYIPSLPFIDGLVDMDANVRKAAVLALEKYYIENPNSLDLDEILKKMDTNDNDALNSILTLLGKLWKNDPEKILSISLSHIKSENEQLKNNISQILINNYSNNPKIILKNLIKVPDVSKFVTKGIIADTIIKIAKQDSKKVISKLLKYLDSDDENIVFNSIASLDGLVNDHTDRIKLKPIISLLKKESSDKIKKEANKLIQRTAKINPMSLEPVMDVIFQFINDQELSVKIALSKSIFEIARKNPEIIPVTPITKFLDDEDSFIRESGVKILGTIGFDMPDDIISSLINKALLDEEWNVREAAVSSLGNILEHVEDKNLIIEKLVSLLDDDQGWVRRSVIKILSNIKELNASQIPFKKVLRNIKDKDSNVREASAGLLILFIDDIDKVLESLIILLGDESEDVRNSAIKTTIDIIYKVDLETILSKLLQNLSDQGSIDTQRSIAVILGRTVKYRDDQIKKRVIALLKIRCEMSQDPLICKTLNELRESLTQ